MLAVVAMVWIEAGGNAGSTNAAGDRQIVQVAWVDGDSGTINGQAFRLHGVDAPEGSPERARCVRERAMSQDARNAARSMTESQNVRIKRSHGADAYGRLIVDLEVGGRDVAEHLVAAGHLKTWDFDGGDAKPDWCG